MDVRGMLREIDYEWWLSLLENTELDVQDLAFGWMLEKVSVEDLLEGSADLGFRLTGPATTLQAFLDNARGRVEFVGGPGRVATRMLDLWASDFLTLIKPATWLGDDVSEFNCLIARFEVRQERARSDSILMDTLLMTIVGLGVVDLHEGRLTMVFAPKPKKSTATYNAKLVQMSGTLSKLYFSSDEKQMADAATGLLPGTSDPTAEIAALKPAASCEVERAAGIEGALVGP